jgi:hypothetical protein
MNTYKYSNGVLESIEMPTDLKWVQTGKNYFWYCGLPSEETVGDMAEGFNIAVYRAASDRAPYPFVAIVGFGGECREEIYFPQLEDLIHYARSHARLLQLTLLANFINLIHNAIKWLFDSKDGIFRDHDMTKGDNK